MELNERREINEKLDLILSRLDATNKWQEQADGRFEQIDKRFEQIDKRFGQIDKRFERIDNRFERLEKKVDGIDRRLINVELTIENELRPNIQILAEGQSVIMRKLDELTKVRDEHDYTKIRLDVLESRVNRLEEKVS